MNGRFKWLLACSPLLIFLAVSCSTTKSSPTAPAADVTAPFVVSVDPGINGTGVAVGQDITVVFSEAMDPASHTGNVTLSSGTISTMTWSDDRTLVITHTNWADGVEVTVTFGAGLTDVAGNALEAVFAANFWTASATVQLLSSNPASGITGVLRNPQILMLFSHEMNLTSLNSATTVTNTTAGGTVPFTLTDGGDTWVGLSFPSTLDASTSYRIDITTAAQAEAGGNLASAAAITFTTGADIDTEAPTVVSIEPANGTTIDANTGSIRITFSEPIDINQFSPESVSAQMMMYVAGEPTWSENNTVITVALASPLPAGLPIAVDFASFQDAAGNVQAAGISYAVDVAGTPDFFPLTDGLVFMYSEDWTDTSAGANDAEGSRTFWERVEQDDATNFRMVGYDDEGLTQASDWDFLRKVGGGVDFIGFHESEEGGPGEDILFSSPIPWTKSPWQVQSWNGATTATTTEGTMTVNYTVAVLLQEDLIASSESEEDLVWKNCWKVQLDYTLSAGGETFSSGTDVMWYAPTIGVVKSSSVENQEGGGVYTSDETLVIPNE